MNNKAKPQAAKLDDPDRMETLEQAVGDIQLMLDELNKRLNEVEDRLYLNKNMLSLSEAADYTGFRKQYLYQLASCNKIPHYRPIGKRVFFKKCELDQWLSSNQSDWLPEKEEVNHE